jgi:hypothetical protein
VVATCLIVRQQIVRSISVRTLTYFTAGANPGCCIPCCSMLYSTHSLSVDMVFPERSPVLCAMCEPILPASAVTQASPNRPLSPCMPARLSFRCCDSCERALRLAESLPALEDAGALRRRPGPRGAPRAAVRRRQEQAAARADERVHDGGSG